MSHTLMVLITISKLKDFFHTADISSTRTVEGQQYSIRCRKAGSLDAPEEIILDENVLAEGLEYSSLGITGISPNHKLYAYNHDKEGINWSFWFLTFFLGDEKYTLYIKDLETGKLLSDVIPNTYYSFEWANDNKTFFYTILDHACRSFKVFRHTLGCEEETLIMHEEDEKFSLGMFGPCQSHHLAAEGCFFFF